MIITVKGSGHYVVVIAVLNLCDSITLQHFLCDSVLFQIQTFPLEPEDEAHIGPTATYDEVIYPGFQHDITALQIQGYSISYNRHTTASNTIQHQKIHV